MTEALNEPDARPEAAEALRLPIDKIVPTPGSARGDIYATLHRALRTTLD